MATLAVTGSLAESGGGKAVLLQVDQEGSCLPYRCKTTTGGDAGEAYFSGVRALSRGSGPTSPQVNSGQQPLKGVSTAPNQPPTSHWVSSLRNDRVYGGETWGRFLAAGSLALS